jgi:hypothetical protein
MMGLWRECLILGVEGGVVDRGAHRGVGAVVSGELAGGLELVVKVSTPVGLSFEGHERVCDVSLLWRGVCSAPMNDGRLVRPMLAIRWDIRLLDASCSSIGGRTSRTASRSFVAGSFFVEPLGFSITVVSVLYSVAKSGLFLRTTSSTGGNMATLKKK